MGVLAAVSFDDMHSQVDLTGDNGSSDEIDDRERE